jgi:tetratricopeptide (TPR) repeat protein
MARFAAKDWNTNPYWRMVKGMRATILPSTILLCTIMAMPSLAEDSASTQVVQAYRLEQQGQPKAAIAILIPLLQPDAHSLNDTDTGVSWILLGSSYQDLEMYDQSRRCYEAAIRKLKPLSSAQGQYASAIDNLGAIESLTGNLSASRALRESALHAYEAMRDHAGIARVSSNLAMIALLQKDFKTAHVSLATAFEEIQSAPELDEDDAAAIYSVKGALALHDKQYRQAILAYRRTLDIWARKHGPDYFMMGNAYAMRAQAFAKSGDFAHSIADIQEALAHLEKSMGRNSSSYVRAQMLYAQILQAKGETAEASRLEKEAGIALAEFKQRQCGGCTISIESLR